MERSALGLVLHSFRDIILVDMNDQPLGQSPCVRRTGPVGLGKQKS